MRAPDAVGLPTTTLTDSTVSDNDAYFGGGIFAVGTTKLFGTTVSGNAANQGGGIQAASAPGGAPNLPTTTLTDSTVSGNTASYHGGGILALNITKLTRSTVSGNTAGDGGGGGIISDFPFIPPRRSRSSVRPCAATRPPATAAGSGVLRRLRTAA